jgi:tetratricopeptide (TPR) repeat protein/O-antigen ligase
MVILRLAARLALWGLAWLLLALAWMSTASASAFDSRVPWGLAVCGLAWLAGTLLTRLAARRLPRRFRRLDATCHGLSLVTMAVCAHALSHAGADMSIRLLREEIPPLFAPLYPLLAGAAPLLFSAGLQRRSPGRLALLLAVFVTSLSGSVFMLEPPAAAGLGLVALLLVADERPLQRLDGLLVPGALFVVLVALATARGHSLLAALPSLTWIVGLAALGLAAALAEGGAQLVRDVLAAFVLAAVVVAVSGAALTVWLGLNVDWKSALATRLVLFRQHPNFLAPFFGVNAVLAGGLALRRARSTPGWLAAALLLAASTILTDSRTGIASMAAGFALLPLAHGLRALTRRLGGRAVGAAVVLLPVLAVGGWFLVGGQSATTRVTAGLDRFEKSMEFRVDAWRNSVQVIRQYPWLGIGPHTFIAVERFRPGSRFYNEPESPHPHNMLLYVAQAAGLPALAMVLLWCGWLLWRGWSGFRRDGPELPGALPLAILAGSLTALLASLFDLGLSLDSVVPAPLFVLTGLLAVRGTGPARAAAPATPVRPIVAIAWGLALAVLVVRFTVQPLRAQTLSLQAQLMAWESQQDGEPRRLQLARDAMSDALAIYPPTPKAHDLLSRWLEQAGDDQAAQDVLRQMVQLAPRDATSHSLLGHLYMRHAKYGKAAEELDLALQDIHGSLQENRDRADRITCLAALGQRDEAMELLVEALRIDSGVIALLPWQDADNGVFRMRVSGTPPPPPIALVDGVDALLERRKADHAAGRAVDRRSWLDTYRAFRVARRDDKAAAMLDWLEANLPAGVIEPETLASERGQLAFDAHDYAAAQLHFQHALDVSHNRFFEYKVAEVRRARGEAVSAAEMGQTAMAATGEILDQPLAFRDNFLNQEETLLALGRADEAAETARRTLLFEDDLLPRVRLLAHVAELQLRGGQPGEAVEALREACELLAAKPFPWATLQEDATTTLPGRLADLLFEAWRRQGLDRTARQKAAWGLPSYFSSRPGPALLRLAFYQRNAQVDQLMREAELQILADPHDLPAMWARLFALEAAGRHLELGPAMRDIVEEFGRTASPQRLFDALRDHMSDRLGDPRAWEQLALLSLLRGKYGEAIDMYDHARHALQDDPADEARVCGWQAMAAFLAGRPEDARRILQEAARLTPDDEMLRLRLAVIPEVLPP